MPLPLENMREGMLDQRYIASFRLVFAKKEKSTKDEPESNRKRMGRGRLVNVIGIEDQHFLQAIRSGSTFGDITGPFFDRLNEFSHSQRAWLFSLGFHQVPKGTIVSEIVLDKRKMSKEVFSAFAGQNSVFIKSVLSNDEAGDPAYDQILLLSPTTEGAKQIVEMWFGVYDWGICYPAQKECLDVKKTLLQKLADDSQKLKKTEANMSDAEQGVDKYKEFADITHEALVGLTTQRRMLESDLAGIKARLEACQQMLAKGNMPPARMDQVETARPVRFSTRRTWRPPAAEVISAPVWARIPAFWAAM